MILAGERGEAPTQLVLSRVTLDSTLDLSYDTVHTTLVLDRCVLAGGLTVKRANLEGLELYDTQVPFVDVSWAQVHGDLRLVNVQAPTPAPTGATRTGAHETGRDAPGAEPAQAAEKLAREPDRETLLPIGMSSTTPPRPQGDAATETDDGPAGPSTDEGQASTGEDGTDTAEDVFDVPATPPRGRTPVAVSCAGARVTGEVNLAGSSIAEGDADALFACRATVGERAAEDASFSWERLMNAIGLASALVLWIVVVGGATMWARLDAIGAPALPALTSLGQTWMATAGLQTLLTPMLLGTVVALLAYFSRRLPLDPARPADTFESSSPAARAPAGSTTSEDAPEDRPHVPALVQRGLRALRTARHRPLIAWRTAHREGDGRVLVPAVVGVVVAGLYVAHASLLVLGTTAAIVAIGLVVALVRLPGWWDLGLALGGGGAVLAAWLLSDRTQALSFIAGATALVLACVFVAMRRANTSSSGSSLLAALLVVLFVGTVASFLVSVTLGWTVVMAVTTVLAVWITLGALVGKREGATALTLFVAIVVWSGALQYARELGNREPAFPEATLTLEDGSDASGLLVGRTSDVVILAAIRAERGLREVSVYPADRVHSLGIGNQVHINTSDKSVDDSESSSDPTGGGEPGVEQTEYEPPTQEPFSATTPIETLDAEVNSIPVRLGMLGVQRRDGVTYVWLRVVNMDRTWHTVAEMLLLDRGLLDTPIALDPGSGLTYEVAQHRVGCGCSAGLDAVQLQPHAQLNVYAAFTFPASTTNATLTVPAIGTFDDVRIE